MKSETLSTHGWHQQLPATDADTRTPTRKGGTPHSANGASLQEGGRSRAWGLLQGWRPRKHAWKGSRLSQLSGTSALPPGRPRRALTRHSVTSPVSSHRATGVTSKSGGGVHGTPPTSLQAPPDALTLQPVHRFCKHRLTLLQSQFRKYTNPISRSDSCG